MQEILKYTSIVIQGHAPASVLVSSLDKALFNLLTAYFIKLHPSPLSSKILSQHGNKRPRPYENATKDVLTKYLAAELIHQIQRGMDKKGVGSMSPEKEKDLVV